MHGENDINHMNLVKLQTLENNLEMWANNIRSQKVRFIRFLIHTDEIFIFSKRKIVSVSSLDVLTSYIEQMQIISREIDMLRNKVWFSICRSVPATKLRLSNFRHRRFFALLFCRRTYCRLSMACFRKGYCKNCLAIITIFCTCVGVGKSCLLLRFSDGSFTTSFITTIGYVE
jgi:hypothetical protein